MCHCVTKTMIEALYPTMSQLGEMTSQHGEWRIVLKSERTKNWYYLYKCNVLNIGSVLFVIKMATCYSESVKFSHGRGMGMGGRFETLSRVGTGDSYVSTPDRKRQRRSTGGWVSIFHSNNRRLLNFAWIN